MSNLNKEIPFVFHQHALNLPLAVAKSDLGTDSDGTQELNEVNLLEMFCNTRYRKDGREISEGTSNRSKEICRRPILRSYTKILKE